MKIQNIYTGRKSLSFTLLLISLILGSIIFLQIDNEYNYKASNVEYHEQSISPKSAAQETLTAVWFKNPTFDDPVEPEWYSQIQGDQLQVNASAGSGQANYEILGETRTFSQISGTPILSEWTQVHNPEFPLYPDTATINAEGCFVSHTFAELATQFPSVHWERNMTMPVNMSDYVITSASIDAVTSGEVVAYPGGYSAPPNGGGVECPGDATGLGGTQNYTWDYARFYVLLSDLSKSKVYEVAYNQTVDLGKDSAGLVDTMPDTLMTQVSENDLIFALTSILNSDYENFTITLGIRIWCEDNWLSDRDIWNSLQIKSCNLTFEYQKKIDQFSSISWNQDGDKITSITNNTVEINSAKLNFEYKINDNWTCLSPNSEFRIYINDNKLVETIKLSNASISYQFAQPGGIDVKSLIPYNININLSIQVYLADEFHLGEKSIISIDNAYLNITYTVTFPDTQTNLHVFFNTIDKTLNPIYQVPIQTNLNLTVIYPDEYGEHIPGAIIQLSGNLTGTLLENDILGQYSIDIDTGELPIGELYFEIFAHRINYEARKISAILIVTSLGTKSLQLILNGEDITSDPFVDVPINKVLNFTVKYEDVLGNHVPGALVQLTGDGILETLDENATLEQYSAILNTSIKFSLGVNFLNIKAQEEVHEEQYIYPRITVRKIKTQITPVSGSDTINIVPGESATLRVFVNDTDFNTILKGLIVTYSWDFGEGILLDDDNDGIYETTFNIVPAGIHSVNLTAFGSEIYNFESYKLTITAVKPKSDAFLFQLLLIIAITASIIVGGYLYAYQKILKYPKQVRKVKKYLRTLKSKSTPNIEIIDRKKAFEAEYKKELKVSSQFLKGKPVSEEMMSEPDSKKPLVKSQTNSNIKTPPQNSKSQELDKNLNVNLSSEKLIRTPFRTKLRRFRISNLKLWKNKKILYSIVILFILVLNLLILSNFMNFMFNGQSDDALFSVIQNNYDNLAISRQETSTKPWLNNTEFNDPIEPIWFPTYGELGDKNDVYAKSGSGHANLSVIGDYGVFSEISGVPKSTDWMNVTNPNFPALPDFNEIDEYGCEVSHTWIDPDDPIQSPSVHWVRNVTMPVDMSDYIITSASISAVFNATVTTDSGNNQGNPFLHPGVDTELDYPDQKGDYDSAKFYVLLSDLGSNEIHEVAWYQTIDLGQDSPEISTIIDSLMNTVVEETLIYYLTSLFERDNFHFSIILGIRIKSVDNYNYDTDQWDSLRIKSCNLTFTYEKRIDQFTSVAWSQNARKISDISNYTVVVDKALINFKYKIDQNWTESSPNSELRVLINNNPYRGTVKLSTATQSYQQAKIGGFDITSLITDDVNVSIQLFLADKFRLDHNITISIDDVTLNITYTIYFPDKETELYLFLNKENRTSDLNFALTVGEQLNITVKYLNKTGEHIPNATITLLGNFTGTFTQNLTLKQYTLILDTDIGNIGVNFLTITAYAPDHELRKIYPIVTVNTISTDDLQLFLNNENKTNDKNIELIVGQELNITVKYTDAFGIHIPNATVTLFSEGLTKDLNESITLEQHTIIINTTERFRIGVNYLTLRAQDSVYEIQYAVIRVSIRKINIEIKSVSSSDTIEKLVGEEALLRVFLNNTDFGCLIKNAIVTYVWENGNGIFSDQDDDGIYEATIQNLPEGVFSFVISALVGDDYMVQNYIILVIVSTISTGGDPIFPILFTVFTIITAGLVTYLFVYQSYLKYPPTVRKVRKYRKTLRRKSNPNTKIVNREKSFRREYKQEISGSKLHFKPQPMMASSLPSKKMELKVAETKMEPDQLTEKVIEKKEELDELVKDSSKKPSSTNKS